MCAGPHNPHMESGLRAVEGEGISGKKCWLWLLTSFASVLVSTVNLTSSC